MNKRQNKNRKKIISLLLMLSLVLTTGTFAFWASYVEGTSEEATGTLTVGYAEGVETKFDLTNELNSGGFLVPSSQLYNSMEHSVDSITLSYDLSWQEAADLTQLEGTISTGDVSISHSLIIEVDGKELDSKIYSTIFDLVKVNYSTNNPEQLTLDGDVETFSFYITMDEPTNQEEYSIISNASVSILFSFRIFDNFVDTNDAEIQQNGPYISLVGNDVIYVEIGETYEDQGVVAYNSLGEVFTNTWTRGEVNTWKLGTYEISYGAYSSYDNQTLDSATRTIIVVDTKAPVITMNGAEVFNVSLGSYYNDWGAWATDNSNQAINVTVTGVEDVDINIAGTYYVTYTAVDASGNEAIEVRTINVK